MKFLVLLVCVALMGGADASFKDVISKIGDALKPAVSVFENTATSLLQNIFNTGKKLLGDSLQALVLNIGSATHGRRDLSQLLHVIPSLESTLHSVIDKAQSLFHGVVGKFAGSLMKVLDKVSHLEITPEAVVAKIDQLVGSHNILLDGILGQMVKTIEEAVFSHKRSLSAFGDVLKGFATQVSNFFKPQVQAIKDLATTTGTMLKNAASGIITAGKQSLSDLVGKLSEHISTLKDVGSQLLMHGTNALSALKAASSDILAQTVQNMKQPIQTAKETLSNAGSTIVQHVAQTLGGSN